MAGLGRVGVDGLLGERQPERFLLVGCLVIARESKQFGVRTVKIGGRSRGDELLVQAKCVRRVADGRADRGQRLDRPHVARLDGQCIVQRRDGGVDVAGLEEKVAVLERVERLRMWP